MKHLYRLQGKNVDEDTIEMFLCEFDRDGIPMEAVISACESLKDKELTYIKYATIKNAARRFCKEKDDLPSCGYCKSGVVELVNQKDRTGLLQACKCQSGEERNAFARWTGEDVVYINGIEYRHYMLDLLGGELYEQVKSKKIVCSESGKRTVKEIVKDMADTFDATYEKNNRG